MLHEKTYGYCLNRCIFMMNRLSGVVGAVLEVVEFVRANLSLQ